MLTLQFGQCGNQLGDVLFRKITKDIGSTSPGTSFTDCYEYSEATTSKWFEGTSQDGRNIARVILIDAERKVINKIIAKNDESFCYRSRNIITPGDAGGSANNWAFGYTRKGPEFHNWVLEAVRREVERADRLDGFLCLLSCAGGTGSGLGSFILSSLRDEFPLKNIIAAPVLPFPSGEVATQNYNAVLSLAKVLEDSDLVVVLENQKLNGEISQNPKMKIDFPRDVNDIAAQQILSVFQPARDSSSNRYNDVNYIISKVSPHPGFKLATVEAVPLIPDTQNNASNFQTVSMNYSGHFKALKKEISTPRGIKSLSNILITRGTAKQKGKKMFSPDDDDSSAIDQLIDRGIYSKINWLKFDERITHFHQKRNFLGNERFSSVISNNSGIAGPLDDILAGAWRLYTHGAFLHQYKQHGLEDDDFLRAFAKLESAVKSYKSLQVD
ncbi:tubulin delta chain [Diachasma alloeum]|uniref:tubulin delta chain n=1 Tax=Diachasma alloeum TaxID=454923 RepID=UPI0007384DC2|nr:tubulin delta chain [Diachasma alloeum]